MASEQDMTGGTAASRDSFFQVARPIWPAQMEREMNRFVGFRAVVRPPPAGRLLLRVTASSLYRAFAAGDFLGCGPARAAHGYFRVDEWSIDATGPELLIAIEVAGYNVNSYYVLDQPAFLIAEVTDERDEVLAATGATGRGFDATLLRDHVRNVERYSVARTFSEVFRLRADSNRWRDELRFDGPRIECRESAPVKLLPRGAPYPSFEIAKPQRDAGWGAIETISGAVEFQRDWTLTCIGPDLKGFAESELEVIPSLELQKLRSIPDARPPSDELSAGTYRTLDFGQNLSSFIRFHFTCTHCSRAALVFDEILSTDGDVSFNRLRCNNVIWIDAEAGEHRVETLEPYTLRYLKIMCLDGACRIGRVDLRRYEHAQVSCPRPMLDDARLDAIWDAGVATFRQNAVDLLTDCPSRERAAWLCDSFYTARAAFALTGSTALERTFLENYLLPEAFEHLPDGMVPMNYPADHPNGKFIPNWALWLVLQLEEYLHRSGDRAMIDAFRPRVQGIFRYFERFQNPDGLLEKLDGWVFIEWSAANDFVQDVNYPTNMLYAAALDAAGRLYDRPDWMQSARNVRSVVAAQSFDGEFFADNSVRAPDRNLIRTTNRTEVCQYHAFAFDVATPQSHPQLWQRLVEQFGPSRAATGAFPEVYAANALMGYTLRLELLSRYGLLDQLRREIVEYFHPMTAATGTLWEHSSPAASCCHGFASHVCCWLLRLAQQRVSPPRFA
jgi:alpha-L-rhamnosidase